jgi:hypothetical protein
LLHLPFVSKRRGAAEGGSQIKVKSTQAVYPADFARATGRVALTRTGRRWYLFPT